MLGFSSPDGFLSCCMSYVPVMNACSRRQNTLLVITKVSLQTLVAGHKNVHGDLKIVFKTLTEKICMHGLGLHWSQADQGTPAQEGSGCASEFCVILWQLHHHLEILSLWARPASPDLLHLMENNVQNRYAPVVACFVGRSLGPALCRAEQSWEDWA